MCDLISDIMFVDTKDLPDGELNPGLPRDRRGYLPLYYRGFDEKVMNARILILWFHESWCELVFKKFACVTNQTSSNVARIVISLQKLPLTTYTIFSSFLRRKLCLSSYFECLQNKVSNCKFSYSRLSIFCTGCVYKISSYGVSTLT